MQETNKTNNSISGYSVHSLDYTGELEVERSG